MEQAKKPRSTAAKVALVIAAVIIAAVASTLVQQLLFGKTSVATTSAVIAVTTFSMWRLLWMNSK